MLTPEKLKQIRDKAQEAVTDMPDGELKTKAFEVILQHLLSTESQVIATFEQSCRHQRCQSGGIIQIVPKC